MKIIENFTEWLSEFNDDGSVYQLAAGKSWNEVWTDKIEIGGKVIITVKAGWTSTMANVHTAVVSVIVNPRLNKDGAEDQATESIVVYFKDWVSEEDAVKDVERFRSTTKVI